MSTESIKSKVAKRTTGKVGEGFFSSSANLDAVHGMYKRFESQFRAMVPDDAALALMYESLVLALQKMPKLQTCSLPSVFGAFVNAASLRLVPNDPGYGHCWILPRKGKATFQLGYQGAILLMTREGVVTQVRARNVYDCDHFELTYGDEERLTHIPVVNRPEGATYEFSYAIATLPNGQLKREIVPRADMAQIKEMALKNTGNTGPWVTWPEEMQKKTAIFRLSKTIPRERGLSIYKHDGVLRANPERKTIDLEPDIIDATPEVVNAEVAPFPEPVTGEVVNN